MTHNNPLVKQREIKFRVWRTDDKMMMDHDWLAAAGIVYWAMFTERRRKEAIVMQFMGLKDRDGKEIYEGDIITYDLSPGLGEPPRYGLKRVVSDSPYGAFGRWDTNIRVIGNVFENPEMYEHKENEF